MENDARTWNDARCRIEIGPDRLDHTNAVNAGSTAAREHATGKDAADRLIICRMDDTLSDAHNCLALRGRWWVGHVAQHQDILWLANAFHDYCFHLVLRPRCLHGLLRYVPNLDACPPRDKLEELEWPLLEF